MSKHVAYVWINAISEFILFQIRLNVDSNMYHVASSGRHVVNLLVTWSLNIPKLCCNNEPGTMTLRHYKLGNKNLLGNIGIDLETCLLTWEYYWLYRCSQVNSGWFQVNACFQVNNTSKLYFQVKKLYIAESISLIPCFCLKQSWPWFYYNCHK